jgi:hypothetical protein
LLLLLDGKHRILSDFGFQIARRIGILERDQIGLVVLRHFVRFVSFEQFVYALFAEQILLEFVSGGFARGCWRGIHPIHLIDALFAACFFLKTLQLLQLSLLFPLFTKLLQLLALF